MSERANKPLDLNYVDLRVMKEASPEERAEILSFASAVVSSLDPTEVSAGIQSLMTARRRPKIEVEGEPNDKGFRKKTWEYGPEEPDPQAIAAGLKLALEWWKLRAYFRIGMPVERRVIETINTPSAEDRKERLVKSPEFIKLLLQEFLGAMPVEERRKLLEEPPTALPPGS